MDDLLLKIGGAKHVQPALLPAYVAMLKREAKKAFKAARRAELEACIAAVKAAPSTGNKFPVTALEQERMDCINVLVARRKTPNDRAVGRPLAGVPTSNQLGPNMENVK